MKDCTIQDIADEASVSPTTVSRVFSKHSYVSEDTRKAVLDAAQRLGYEPKHYTHRAPAETCGALIGMVVADLHNPFFMSIYDSAQRVLNGSGNGLVVCDSKESPQQEIANLNALKNRVSGLIVSPVSETAEYNALFLKELNSSGTPVILLDRDLKNVGLDGVFQENYTGTFEAIECFISNGHRNIGIITGPNDSKPGHDRLNAYMDALRQHNLPLRQEYIAYGDFQQESGRQLAGHMLKSYPEITALFCSNNLMTLGALQAIHELGKSIPRDIAFISYGSLSHKDFYQDIAISALDQPVKLMGEECARLILDRLGSGKKRTRTVRRITCEPTLILSGTEKLIVP